MKQQENTLYQFKDKEKIAGFDLIAAQYFERNFGAMSKTDFETLLFSIYIEHCLKQNVPFDDYTLSKNLGITQSKVRNLKTRKQLQYPYKDFEWKKAFIECIKNAHYDEVKHLVKLNIPDVNVMMELRHHLEEQGWYDEYQLNPKLFQCRADIFVLLCNSLEENGSLELQDEAKKTIKKLMSESKNEKEKSGLEKILSGSLEDGLKEIALSSSKLVFQWVLGQLPFGGLAGSAINAIIKVLENT